jgi:hypothetical protein
VGCISDASQVSILCNLQLPPKVSQYFTDHQRSDSSQRRMIQGTTQSGTLLAAWKLTKSSLCYLPTNLTCELVWRWNNVSLFFISDIRCPKAKFCSYVISLITDRDEIPLGVIGQLSIRLYAYSDLLNCSLSSHRLSSSSSDWLNSGVWAKG